MSAQRCRRTAGDGLGIKSISRKHAAMQIRTANDADLSEIRNPLRANDLPVQDVSTALIEGFLVAEDASGPVIGSGGLEQLGSSVLLRSLAVAPGSRGKGIEWALVAHLKDNARSCGQQDAWLLTTIAERFFERAGYKQVCRDEVPGEVRPRQFTVLCPSTATCMRKRLRTILPTFICDFHARVRIVSMVGILQSVPIPRHGSGARLAVDLDRAHAAFKFANIE
jgi:amino-acid N-acetyltransferase